MTSLRELVVASTLVFVAPAELTAGEPMNTNPAESPTIVVIGASYAGGWQPERPVAGFRIIAKGISGEQSSQVLDRFDADAIALKPEAVIIWGFINDIFRGDRSRMEEVLRGTRHNLQEMVARARHAGIVPILATEVTIRGKDSLSERGAAMLGRIMGKESYQDYINGHVKGINEWIRTTAQRDGILLLDLASVLADSNGVRRKEFAKPDGSHISPEGYEALTRYADERLMAVLSGG